MPLSFRLKKKRSAPASKTTKTKNGGSSSSSSSSKRDDTVPVSTEHSKGEALPSKIMLLASLAKQKKFSALLDLVAKSDVEDWYAYTTTSSSSSSSTPIATTESESSQRPVQEELERQEPGENLEQLPPSLWPQQQLQPLQEDESSSPSEQEQVAEEPDEEPPTYSQGETPRFLQRSTSTPLHLLVMHNPPLRVLESLISTLETKFSVHVPEECPDNCGRTPLHIAVTHGCDKLVARRLLSGSTLIQPALLRDKEGRLALHYACSSVLQPEKSMFGGKPRVSTRAQARKREILFLLLQEYPEAVLIPDKYGKTPLEYARNNPELTNNTEQYCMVMTYMEKLVARHSPNTKLLQTLEPKEEQAGGTTTEALSYATLEDLDVEQNLPLDHIPCPRRTKQVSAISLDWFG